MAVLLANEFADDLEEMADCGLEEVRAVMNRLYDEFDYQRICVVS